MRSQRRLSLFLLFPTVLAASLLTGCSGAETGTPVREWILSTNASFWTDRTADLGTRPVGEAASAITIDLSRTLQTIDGFGGCFNELGWDALQKVSPRERQSILRNLFDPETGCKFNICRMPLGANDYSVDWYSLDETPGDYEMAHFSIDRDRQRLIPYIKAAQAINPGIRIWASPWSPPTWMKVNQHYACRADAQVNDLSADRQGREMQDQFIMDDRTLSAYALYFSRFVQAYRDEGIDIYAVHVQNEPNSCQNFPSCIWTPESLARFIGQYLGPRFEQDQLGTQIWLGTIERPQPERVDAILRDEAASKYVTGVGFQWAGKGVIAHVHETYPNLKLMQTETECGRGTNDWGAMEHTFSLMQHYFANGAEAYMYWNMVLDHTGKSQWGWKQNSMISISENGEVSYNPEFYLMKHFSAFVRPGARYLQLDTDENCLAFANPDGEVIVVYYNETDESRQRTLAVGRSMMTVELPAKSLSTFRLLL